MHYDRVFDDPAVRLRHGLPPGAGSRGSKAPLRARYFLLPLALSALTSSARADDVQIYKTVDAQGNVVFSDRSTSSGAAKTSVTVHEPSAQDLKQAAQARLSAQAAELQHLQETLASRSQQTQLAQQQQAKKSRCDSARSNYYSLRDAARIYQLDAQGNRVFLPDEAADAKRAEARRAMDTACGS
jgi:thymidylate kinase